MSKAIKEVNENNTAVEEVIDESSESVEEVIDESSESVEEVIERQYTLRKLKDGDLMPLLKLFRKIGLKNFKEAIQQFSEGKTIEEVGLSAIIGIGDTVIANLETAEEEIYSMWSEISGLSVEDIKNMEFGTLPLMIYDSFSEVRNTAFFKVLSKLL